MTSENVMAAIATATAAFGVILRGCFVPTSCGHEKRLLHTLGERLERDKTVTVGLPSFLYCGVFLSRRSSGLSAGGGTGLKCEEVCGFLNFTTHTENYERGSKHFRKPMLKTIERYDNETRIYKCQLSLRAQWCGFPSPRSGKKCGIVDSFWAGSIGTNI